MNKYKGYDDERLIEEYQYLAPMGDPQSQNSIDTVKEMSGTDIMHLLMIMEAMAERIE